MGRGPKSRGAGRIRGTARNPGAVPLSGDAASLGNRMVGWGYGVSPAPGDSCWSPRLGIEWPGEAGRTWRRKHACMMVSNRFDANAGTSGQGTRRSLRHGYANGNAAVCYGHTVGSVGYVDDAFKRAEPLHQRGEPHRGKGPCRHGRQRVGSLAQGQPVHPDHRRRAIRNPDGCGGAGRDPAYLDDRDRPHQPHRPGCAAQSDPGSAIEMARIPRRWPVRSATSSAAGMHRPAGSIRFR